jgi:hypothetical protein
MRNCITHQLFVKLQIFKFNENPNSVSHAASSIDKLTDRVKEFNSQPVGYQILEKPQEY